MPVTGDFSQAKQLAGQLREMREAIRKTAKALAKSVKEEISREFFEARDAFGKPWTTSRSSPKSALTKNGKRKRTEVGVPTNLHDSGGLQSSIRVSGSGGKVRVKGSYLARLYQYAWKTATLLPWKNSIGTWRAMMVEQSKRMLVEHLHGR